MPDVSLLITLSFPNQEPERGSLEAESIPDLIFQISGIRKMHQLLVIYKNDEGGRLHCHLGNIEKLQALSLV